MDFKEAELVTPEFCKEDTNYNLCPGGRGGFGYLNANNISKNFFNEKNAKFFSKKGNEKRSWLLKNDLEFRKKFSEQISKFSSQRIGEKSAFFGKHHSQEWKENHSKIMKEKQKGEKNSNYGKMWITNGVENRTIIRTDSIPDGWCKGRKI